MPRSHKTSKTRIPHLSTHWSEVRRRIQSARNIWIFLDFDGTLVDLAPRPELVRMRDSTRRVLKGLAAHPRVAVIVVSGRRLRDLRERVGIPGVRCLGLYGSERDDGGFPLPRAARDALRSARKRAEQVLRSHPAIWLENKHASFVVHWIDASAADWNAARLELEMAMAPYKKDLSLIHNLRDSEVIPKTLPGKGVAVQMQMAHGNQRGRLGFYFGDDISDESAFSALRSGITVLTGKRRSTRARFYLRSPLEVTRFLERMEGILS